MRLPLASVFFLVASGLLAQDPKAPTKDPATPAAKSPTKAEPKVYKAPEGWSYRKAKDTTYAVLFPKENRGIEDQDRTFNQAGYIGDQLIMSCSLNGDRELMVIATTNGGPVGKDLKIVDAYPLLHKLDKSDPGNTVSELKEFQVGIFKGREYFVTKKGEVERNVIVAIRGRIFQLLVTGPDMASVTDKTAETFVTSLLILKPAPKKPTDGGEKKPEGNTVKPESKSSEKKPEGKSTEKPSKEGSEKQ